LKQILATADLNKNWKKYINICCYGRGGRGEGEINDGKLKNKTLHVEYFREISAVMEKLRKACVLD